MEKPIKNHVAIQRQDTRSQSRTVKTERETDVVLTGMFARVSCLPSIVGSGSYQPLRFVLREPTRKIRYSHFAKRNGLRGVSNSHQVPTFLLRNSTFNILSSKRGYTTRWRQTASHEHTGKFGEETRIWEVPISQGHEKGCHCQGRELSSGPGAGHLRNPDNPGLRAARGEDDSWSRTKAVARAGA